jgi:hypothetical protein
VLLAVGTGVPLGVVGLPVAGAGVSGVTVGLLAGVLVAEGVVLAVTTVVDSTFGRSATIALVVGEADGVDVSVSVASPLGTLDGVAVVVGVLLATGVSVTNGVIVGVWLGVVVAVDVSVLDGVIVGVWLGVVVAVGVSVTNGVIVGVSLGKLVEVGDPDVDVAVSVPGAGVEVRDAVGGPCVCVGVLDAVGMPVMGTRVGVPVGIGGGAGATGGNAGRAAVGDAVAGARAGVPMGVWPRPRLPVGVLDRTPIAGAGAGLVVAPTSPAVGVLVPPWICWRTAWTVGAWRVAFGTTSLANVGAARSAS